MTAPLTLGTSKEARSDVGYALPSGEERLRLVIKTQGDFLWRSLRRLGVLEVDLADTAQQVFLVMSRKLAEIRPGCERAFLFQTAVRVAANVRRIRQRRREVPEDELIEQPDGAPNPEDWAEQRWRRAQLDAVLDRLSIEMRAVFVLSELEGLPMAQIALLLDIPPGTVASRLRRARVQFDDQARLFHQQQTGRLK